MRTMQSAILRGFGIIIVERRFLAKKMQLQVYDIEAPGRIRLEEELHLVAIFGNNDPPPPYSENIGNSNENMEFDLNNNGDINGNSELIDNHEIETRIREERLKVEATFISLPKVSGTMIKIEHMQRFASPVNPAIYPHLSLVLLGIGLFFTAWFFVYEVTSTKFTREPIKEVLISVIASLFMGLGTLFLLLWIGIYV
ncbi:Transmembrane protein 258 [Lepeophtheirus salmonis]|uniref:Dolichyl-diphosphooligosaccharide-protein glycosyltransferase subunit TMEM258 n=2 Tax=Lepeophtheirus salmonis TaxID=72036 RepID=A0A7R8D4T6_LEPSM|nr:Transmembrane protein 258 [Lepeophtheirus salmonis]CAF3028853.1 Transmembrane protein 258 [Lepeophtheirus salmonis]